MNPDVRRDRARLEPFIRMPYLGYLESPKHTYLRDLAAAGTVAVNVGAIRNGSSSHEHYSSSPSKTLRAAMGCSVRFAGNPGRTKECRIERLAGQHAPRATKAKEKPAGLRLKAKGK